MEKFIGDAVMAVWGAPTAHEDDAERAVRAALELVAAVPALGDGSAPIQARAGVLTGEAAVTIGATNQGMVAGDLVNTASRLQSAAAPGTVLVGEATYRAASTAISFEPAGEQALKGKASPVPAWRAMAVVARRGGSGRSAILEPPFVGREDELRLLKDLFDATARERKSRLMTRETCLGEAHAGLAWGMLAGDHDPEAAAAGAAAEQFFAERGGSATVAAYRAAFVPVQEGAPTEPARARRPASSPSSVTST